MRLGGGRLGAGVRNGKGQDLLKIGQRIGQRVGAGTACLVLAVVFLTGCQNYNVPITAVPGGGSGGGPSGLFITLIPGGTVFVDAGKPRPITAILVQDPSNQGVTWVLSGPGSLSNLTNKSATYTAPTTVNTTAVVTATSVSDPTQVANATMFMVPDPSIPTTSVPNATAGTQYNAVVNVADGSSPFNWSISAGSLPPGLFLTTASVASVTIAGTPTTPGTYTFTLQVLDVCSVAAMQSYTITVSASTSAGALMGGGANNAMLNGNYAFRFSGFGSTGGSGALGFIAEAGSFSADGKGNITGGVLDRNGAAGPQSKVKFTGTYGVGANQLGAMTLDFVDGTSNTFALAVNSTGDARFIEFDDTTGAGTRGSGEMRKRDPALASGVKQAGTYVLELTGVDARGARLAMAGQFTSDESGAVMRSEMDANEGGTMATMVPFSGGASVSADGTGSAEWNVPGFGTLHMSLYAVSADEMFAVGMDAAAPGVPLVAGSVMRQSGGPFTSTSLSGSAVIQMTGWSHNVPGRGQSGFLPTGTVGVLRFDAMGGAQEFALQSGHGDAADVNTSFVLSASAEGRIVLGSAGVGIVYLVSPTRGFVLGTDGNVEAGTLESETGTLAAGFKGILDGASAEPFSPGLAESVYSISFGGDGNGTLGGAVSDSMGLAVNVAPPGVIAYEISNGVVEIFSKGPQGDNMIGLMFVVSPGRAIYVQMGPLAAAPVLIQN
jgi:hypothetical protein